MVLNVSALSLELFLQLVRTTNSSDNDARQEELD